VSGLREGWKKEGKEIKGETGRDRGKERQNSQVEALSSFRGPQCLRTSNILLKEFMS